MNILQAYAGLSDLSWRDKWTEIPDSSPRQDALDFHFESYRQRWNGYLDDVARQGKLWVEIPVNPWNTRVVNTPWMGKDY